MKGVWVKDGSTNSEKIDYQNSGTVNDPILFKDSTAGVTRYDGQLVSYDGTTVKAGDEHDAYSAITFTATIANGKLTVSGFTTATANTGNIDLTKFNGIYTKQP